jgi:hypothetical protein
MGSEDRMPTAVGNAEATAQAAVDPSQAAVEMRASYPYAGSTQSAASSGVYSATSTSCCDVRWILIVK